MAWPTSLQTALKEWASVCSALASGRQILLLRKGGIYESAGEFELEHREFFLFPTYVHQNADMLKPAHRASVEKRESEPHEVYLSAAGIVTDIIQLKSRDQMNRLEDHHIWTKPLIDMRFNYRPENPLYLLLVRAHRLPSPITIANTTAYAGCKSWVPLDTPIELANPLPVLDEARYQLQRNQILGAM